MSTNSPNRSSFLTQKRESRESAINRYQYNTQKSPLVNSPNLNEESESDHIPKSNVQTDLKTKLEILLKHNSQLLNQNAQLSEMVNNLRIELEIRTRRQESEFSKINQEMGSVMVELKGQQQMHQIELARLLDQISKLHDQCHQLEMDKNNELKRQREAHERQLVHQINQIKRCQDDGKSLMELQINKLRETIEMKDFEYESLKTQMKSETEQLKNQNGLLESENAHQRKLKDLQMNEIVRKNRDDMRTALKNLELEKNVEIRQYENRIIKLKRDLGNKDVEMEQQAKKTTGENQQIYLELSSIKQEKQHLLEQIQTLTETTQVKIAREKERITKLSELEKENIESLFQSEKDSLVTQKQKLIQLCVDKSEQIKRLYYTTKEMKEGADSERRELKQLIDELRQRLKQSERSSMEECELLKVKMAQLHTSDVQNLSKFYQNEVASLHLELNSVKEAQVIDRQKIYNLLQQNDELRKNFEVEISKQKSKIQDMKVKFAAAKLEFKEQITSLGTKMELTSQTLVRETEQKQKGAEFFEAEKRKFYAIIEGKDHQIQSIHANTIQLKAINEEEISHLKSQLSILRDSINAKDQEFKDFKNNLEMEYKRKSTKLIEESAKVDPDQQLLKECHELRGKITEFEKDNFKKQKDIEYLARQNRSLQQELGLRAGFIETMQLQSCAAIQDEKQKVRVVMNRNQVSMKDYYEVKLASREKDNDNLKKQLHEKETDLRNVITKYTHLQRKLKDLLEAQDKLSDFQNKIINLGMDQNLIKNMAELFMRQSQH